MQRIISRIGHALIQCVFLYRPLLSADLYFRSDIGPESMGKDMNKPQNYLIVCGFAISCPTSVGLGCRKRGILASQALKR